MKRVTKVALLASALFLAGLSNAFATAQLRLSDGTVAGTVTVTDQGPGDADPTPGVVLYSGPVGSDWILNITGGTTLNGGPSAPYLDLGTFNFSSQANGSLTIEFTENGYLVAGAVTAKIGGTTAGDVTYRTWADAGNTSFAKTTLMTSQGPFGGPAFDGETNGTVAIATPYSITVEAVINHPIPGNTGFNAELVVTPPSCDCVLSISCPPPTTLQCPADTSTNATGMPTITATGDCQPVLTYSDSTAQGNCPGNYVITRTWTATPQCGDPVSCTQTITVQDTTAPAITCSPNKTNECGAPIDFDAPAASDRCGTATITVQSTVTNATCGNTFVATRTWVATDECGNSSTCSQTIATVDTTAPSIACVGNKIVECGSAWDFDAPSASDTCGNAALSIVGTVTNAGCGNTFTATRTWRATDDCGNTAECSQTVRVVDTTPPTIACAQNKSVECTSAWTFDAPSASDTCGNAAISVVGTVTNAGCGNTFTATRTWRAIDDCGNTAECSQTVRVVDTTPPTIICAQSKRVECTSAWTFDAPSASDTCGNAAISIVGTVTNAGCGNTFSATRTWRATDDCGNTAECSQTVTVVDTTPPTITCAQNKTVECGSAWDFNAPSASDTCGNATISIVGTVTNDACGNTFTATRTWRATDDCGNTAECSQTVTVRDTTAPTITCAADKTAECGQAWSFNTPTAADTCGNATIAEISTITNGTGCSITITRTWEATDDCGNKARCSQTVTVRDTTPPAITCPPDTTMSNHQGLVFCTYTPGGWGAPPNGNNPGALLAANFATVYPGGFVEVGRPGGSGFSMRFESAAAIEAYLPNGGTPGVLDQDLIDPTDSSAGVFGQHVLALTLNVDFSAAGITEGSSGPLGSVVLNLPGSPLDGMTIDQILAAANKALGGGSLPGGMTFSDLNNIVDKLNNAFDNCAANSWAISHLSPAPTPPSNPGTATAIDDCDPHPLITYKDSSVSNNCGSAIIRTWYASDNCGNTNSCVQRINVTDTVPPVITCSPNKTVECGQAWTFDAPTTTDGSITIVSTVTNGSGCQYTVTRTWKATDACGNKAQCSQTVTVRDTTPPAITCAPNTTTTNCQPKVYCSYTQGGWGTTPNGNNPGMILAENFATVYPGGFAEIGISGSGGFSAKFTSALAIQNYLPDGGTASKLTSDAVNPTTTSAGVFGAQILALKLNVDFSAAGITGGDSGPLGSLVLNDSSSPLNGKTISQILAIANTLLGGGSVSGVTISTLNPLIDNLNQGFDNCTINGWASSHFSVMTCTVSNTPSTPTATDTCDPRPVITFKDSTVSTSCGSSVTRTWYATDKCGNSNSCTQVINNLTDTTPPVITCSPNKTVDCGQAWTFNTPTATDNSGSATITIVSTVTNVSGSVTTSTRTWKATDPCGNTAQCSQTVTVNCQTQTGCTLTIGYYKNHPSAITPLPIYLGTSSGAKSLKVTSQQIGVDVLGQHTYGTPANGITKLYAQLLAAKLNILHGAGGSAVSSAISSADAFLATHNHLDWGSLSVTEQNSVLSWHSSLDNYNNGVTGPGHCGDSEVARALAPTATPASAQVKLGWKKSQEASSYHVLRSGTPDGPYTTIKTGLTGTNYTDGTVVNGTAYYYVVAALKNGIETTESDEASAVPAAPLTSPWNTKDIGVVGVPGGASYSSSKFTVLGSGRDIWDTSDEFRFVYQAASGDCTIVARVASVGNTDPWAKAGVMIRETLNADSKHSSMFVTPGNGVAAQGRLTTGAASVNANTTGLAAPYWVKVVRTGSTFKAYYSSNGSTWTLAGSQSITMGSSVYIGLGVTSHNDSTLCTAVFDNVTATP